MDNIRTGSALKQDVYHAFDHIIDNYVGIATEFDLIGNDKIACKLYQVEGSFNGKEGLFEWIVDPDPLKGVTH